MKPEEIEALAERLAMHNRWRRGDYIEQMNRLHHEYVTTQYGLDLDAAVELLRGLARDRGES